MPFELFQIYFPLAIFISPDEYVAPSGCLQYHYRTSGLIQSFNYNPSPNPQLNSVGVEGTRQLANLRYGVCIRSQSACSITYSVLASDAFSFTVTGDVGAVDPALLGTGTLQEQLCTTDYIIIPNPSQAGALLTSGIDRFCGLGLNPTTSTCIDFRTSWRSHSLQIDGHLIEIMINLWLFKVMWNHLFCTLWQIATKQWTSEIEALHLPSHRTPVRWWFSENWLNKYFCIFLCFWINRFLKCKCQQEILLVCVCYFLECCIVH